MKHFNVASTNWLDRRLPVDSDPHLLAHTLKCEQCDRIFRAHSQMTQMMERLSHAKLERERLRSQPVALGAWPAAVAALLLLSLTTGWLAFQRSASKEVTRLTPNDHLQSMSSSVAPPPLDLQRTDRLTVVALHQPIFGLQLLTQADWSGTVSSVSAAMAPSIAVPELELETQWMDVVAGEMAPVRDSMNSTFKLLRHALLASSPKKTVDG